MGIEGAETAEPARGSTQRASPRVKYPRATARRASGVFLGSGRR
ncbi:hypothetical protein HMPREF9344_00321 [Cutibacterium acnes HL097PA1]|uniref:Uncharacterized protein n=1 Tax=[Propionibacterium] namnetense SK182B-JCVI TaxID=1051006 RepID=F9NWK2_9ACTN|nr:hypothetical protein HMPREF9575_01678 [Cutibacterium acnes HL110PA1]EFS44408.1 hypothetical protein HMPREF9576_00337 [Cutibacterium acnes HL110PA2]EFS77230.1 hypothetical protein HMPREF9591_00655 [Cutibacterium acnes HL086PA1]EFT08084.1 hypothetical protein HMPREF9618_00950 [Cutibacterium acnes HL082PA1]EFT53437.1 hypothetical protein HMPREF9569_01016 [Cutibacterium acnes HL078PA1]EGE76170.1 hypothetical protein HMPREF9344_00321 [Cutibacterium acnes HL097PA1]EGF04176.1 hypothetical protein